ISAVLRGSIAVVVSRSNTCCSIIDAPPHVLLQVALEDLQIRPGSAPWHCEDPPYSLRLARGGPRSHAQRDNSPPREDDRRKRRPRAVRNRRPDSHASSSGRQLNRQLGILRSTGYRRSWPAPPARRSQTGFAPLL